MRPAAPQWASASCTLCTTSWLQERGIEHPWPVAGLPSVPHCDNGAEFHSKALKTACREYGIKLVYRPPATPRFGGHIERLIGTMMGAVHILPGTTFSTTKVREGYASGERAVLSLRESVGSRREAVFA